MKKQKAASQNPSASLSIQYTVFHCEYLSGNPKNYLMLRSKISYGAEWRGLRFAT
jgi:hypothetical protein